LKLPKYRIKLSATELDLIYRGFICRLTLQEIRDIINHHRTQQGEKPISTTVVQDRVMGLRQMKFHKLEPEQIIEMVGQYHPSLESMFTNSDSRLDMVTPLARDIKEHLGQELIDQAYRVHKDKESAFQGLETEVEDFV
jgi:hypothetical protein